MEVASARRLSKELQKIYRKRSRNTPVSIKLFNNDDIHLNDVLSLVKQLVSFKFIFDLVVDL